MPRHGPGGSASPFAADVPKGYVFVSSETVESPEGTTVISTYHVYDPSQLPRVQPAAPRVPGGAERTGDVTQQYGIFSWEKELPSVIRVEKQASPAISDPFLKRMMEKPITEQITTPSFWTTDPQTGIDVAKMGEGPPGRTYVWTPMDIYNIASFATVAISAGISVKNLVSRIQLSQAASEIATSEANIAKQIFKEPPKVLQTSEWMEKTGTFYQTLETNVPTKMWDTPFSIVPTKGIPTTPFSRTLELAITKGRPLGGLSAIQELIETPSYTLPSIPAMNFFASPALGLSAFEVVSVGLGLGAMLRLPPILRPSRTEVLTPRVSVTPRLVQKPEVTTETVTSQLQIPEQLQLQTQKTEQLQRQILDIPVPTRSIALSTSRFEGPPTDFTRRKYAKKKGRPPMDLYGRFLRVNPVAEAERAWKVLFG